ncbi:hypothetical protein ACERZ8_16110 [Tateyamaria armeniaca]|uniref:DUF922 domain-containing protein n=1 Tax=Tateyamaria armeniaca TaxID=2518930 RepID=A0ABW8V051_9RHOB
MAGKTKISIDVSFNKSIQLKHVAGSALQKEKDGQKTKRTLGVTKPKVEFSQPVLHWDEVSDPINKTITLAIKEVTARVTFSARIWIDKRIDKKCECYAHVFDHEKRHAKIWQAGVKKYSSAIQKAVEDATLPKMDAPEEMKESKAKAFRTDAFKRIDIAFNEAVIKYGKKISAESKKIHTSSELKKTNNLCEEYLL